MDTQLCGAKKQCHTKQSQCGKCGREKKLTTSKSLMDLSKKLDKEVYDSAERLFNALYLLNKYDD